MTNINYTHKKIAVVYASHNKKSKEFALLISDVVNAEVFRIKLFPLSTHSLKQSLRNHIKRTTRSFTKRINTMTTCPIDIDQYQSVILIVTREGNHLSTECLSFINLFYQLFIHSPSQLILIGIDSVEKIYYNDIGRIQSLFHIEELNQYIPIYFLKSSFVFFSESILSFPKKKNTNTNMILIYPNVEY